MNNFINIPDNFNPDISFDEINPQIKVIPPFSLLYKELDDVAKYSKAMWAITFMCHPDDEKNKLYRLQQDKRLEAIKENYYPDFDIQDSLIQKCISEYYITCLSAVQRSLKDEKDFLVRRAKFLKNCIYDLSTMKDLDNAAAKSSKIYESFEQLEEKYFTEKAAKSQVYGGRTETLAERKRI